MRCQVCEAELSESSNLCASCRDELPSPPGLCAEQILATTLEPSGAALVDRWGRAHPLEVMTPIGRRSLARGLAILESSISRNHAEIARDHDGRWILQDLGSSNGSSVGDERVTGRATLTGMALVTFGDVGFYFFADASSLFVGDVHAATTTVRPEDRALIAHLPVAAEVEAVDDARLTEETTFAGLPALPMRLAQPTGGGGGILELAGRSFQLTTVQYELMDLLARRMSEDVAQPGRVRGFVPSALLVAELSWDAISPSEAHLKQLVRRVRRLFEAAELGNLIESSRGFGYRLRFTPVRA